MKTKKVTTKYVCQLGILAAITVVLALCGTFRIGNWVKVSIKFVSVFMTGALLGPVEAGLVAAVADMANAFLTPVGGWLPQITAVELLYGVVFGLFFYKAKDNNKYYLRAFLCSAVQFVISLTVMTAILVQAGYLPGFSKGFVMRIPAAAVTFVLHVVVMSLLRRFVFRLKEGKKVE